MTSDERPRGNRQVKSHTHMLIKRGEICRTGQTPGRHVLEMWRVVGKGGDNGVKKGEGAKKHHHPQIKTTGGGKRERTTKKNIEEKRAARSRSKEKREETRTWASCGM